MLRSAFTMQKTGIMRLFLAFLLLSVAVRAADNTPAEYQQKLNEEMTKLRIYPVINLLNMVIAQFRSKKAV